MKMCGCRHSLWGVWVEISDNPLYYARPGVTPFGECGLKSDLLIDNPRALAVTPFGECGLKLLWGDAERGVRHVTPFGECGLKYQSKVHRPRTEQSLPLGSVG